MSEKSARFSSMRSFSYKLWVFHWPDGTSATVTDYAEYEKLKKACQGHAKVAEYNLSTIQTHGV